MPRFHVRIALTATALACLALAAPATARYQRQAGPGGPGAGGPGPRAAWDLPPEVEQQLQTRRAIELATTLGLADQQAVALARQMGDFHAKRKELRKQTHDAMEQLRTVARTGSATNVDVPALLGKLKDLRQKMLSLSHDEYDSLAKGLSTVQQAKLAVFLRDFPRELRHEVRERWKKHHGARGPGGPGIEPGPPHGADDAW